MTNAEDMEIVAVNEEVLDIDALNDSELYEKLRENNIVAGPIVDSTREVYKKKLKKVFYGEESIVSGEESELVSDREAEEDLEMDEKELAENGEAETVEKATEEAEEVADESLYEEEVVDGANGSLYKSRSDTDDDQPSGVSRPVDAEGLRKRAPSAAKSETDSGGATKERFTSKTPKRNIGSLVLGIAILFFALGVAFFFSMDSEGAKASDSVDLMQEEIQAAADKATNGEDGPLEKEQDFTF